MKTMNAIVVRPVNGEEYLLSRLSNGGALSSAMIQLRKNDLKGARCYALVPEGYPPPDDFDCALASAQRERARRYVQEFLARHLSTPNAVVVFENSLVRPTDACLSTFASNVIIHGDSIFHYLGSGSAMADIDIAMKEWVNAWQNVLFCGADLPYTKTIDNKTIDAFIPSIKTIIMDVYDFDSYFLWSEKPPLPLNMNHAPRR